MKRRKDYSKFKEILDKYQINKFYHFTDRSNIESILKNGGLYSWEDCLKKNIYIPHPGGSELSRNLDRKENLQEYVRISICKRHPMMYYAMTDGRIKKPVILEIDTDILYQDGNIFSNMNAVKSNAIKGSELVHFQKIHFTTALKDSQFDIEDAEKDYYQAEILVKNHIPIHYILNISDFTVLEDPFNKSKIRPSYITQITDENPTAIVFIQNQSYPTNEKIMYKGEQKTISSAICDIINKQLYALISLNSGGSTVHNRYQISVMGYGDYCYNCFEGDLRYKDFVELQELKNNPISLNKTVIEKKTRKGIVQLQSEMPIWIKPKSDGNAYLHNALKRTKYILERWTSLHPNSFPPIVIHISCFGYNGAEDSDVIQLANEIKSLYTKDGNVIFANLIFSKNNDNRSVYFPNTLLEMGKSVFGEMYFLMSSQLPLSFNQMVEEYRLNVDRETFPTAVAFNTSIEDIPKMIQGLIYR